jgi:hypothetical protein
MTILDVLAIKGAPFTKEEIKQAIDYIEVEIKKIERSEDNDKRTRPNTKRH